MRFVCEQSYRQPHNKDLFDKYSIPIRGDQLCRFVSSENMLNSLPKNIGSLFKDVLLPLVEKSSAENQEKVKQITDNKNVFTLDSQDSYLNVQINGKLDDFTVKEGKCDNNDCSSSRNGIREQLLNVEKRLIKLQRECSKFDSELSSLGIPIDDYDLKDSDEHNHSWLSLDISGHGLLPFLRSCLQDPSKKNVIKWTTTPHTKEFQIVRPMLLAELWGKEKRKDQMCVKKLKRSLAYLVRNKRKLRKSESKNFVYSFITDKEQDTPEVEYKEFKPNSSNVIPIGFSTAKPLQSLINPKTESQSEPVNTDTTFFNTILQSPCGPPKSEISTNKTSDSLSHGKRSREELCLPSPQRNPHSSTSSTEGTPTTTPDDLFFLTPKTKKQKLSTEYSVSDNIKKYSSLHSAIAEDNLKYVLFETSSQPTMKYNNIINNEIDSKVGLSRTQSLLFLTDINNNNNCEIYRTPYDKEDTLYSSENNVHSFYQQSLCSNSCNDGALGSNNHFGNEIIYDTSSQSSLFKGSNGSLITTPKITTHSNMTSPGSSHIHSPFSLVDSSDENNNCFRDDILPSENDDFIFEDLTTIEPSYFISKSSEQSTAALLSDGVSNYLDRYNDVNNNDVATGILDKYMF